ncbi:MAG: glycosyltransferase family 4 protein [Paludibacter sp.]|nr:glycosyltransferase family 4 protein [Paludibacter sp.]
MKIVIIWTNIPNYIAACINELASMGCQLLVIQINSKDDSNNTFKFKGGFNINYINLSELNQVGNFGYLLNEITSFKPDFILMSFNNRGVYYKLAKNCKKVGLSIVAACDSYFEGSIKQVIRIILSRFGFHKNYDAIFVPGFKGFEYAKLLNFKENKIIRGLYSCDDNIYRKTGIRRHEDSKSKWSEAFIFIGQLISRKGFDTLIEAYKLYRQQVEKPWELWIIGSGPLVHLTETSEGIIYFNSLIAEECTQKLAMAGCFILPSIIDHWGLVLHEATCAGLPIITTSSCGASIELVQPFYNGIIIPHSDIIALTSAMKYISNDSENAKKMGYNSLQLSNRYSTKLWSEKVLTEIPLVLKM